MSKAKKSAVLTGFVKSSESTRNSSEKKSEKNLQTVIQYRSPSSVTSYARNPRKNDDAVSTVKASIKEFGFKVPVIVDAEGVIVAGHTRVKAALELGLEQIPVIVADDLTPEQVKAFRLIENKSHERAEWDETLLELELSELSMDLQEFEIDWGEITPVILNSFTLADGERPGFEQRTFTLTSDQAALLDRAILRSKEIGDFDDTGNENVNGNAIARIAEIFLDDGTSKVNHSQCD